MLLSQSCYLFIYCLIKIALQHHELAQLASNHAEVVRKNAILTFSALFTFYSNYSHAVFSSAC